MKNKELLGSVFAALSVMAYAFEWWFIRQLGGFGISGFLLLALLFSAGFLILMFGLFSKKLRKSFPKNGKKWLFLFGVVDVLAFSFFFLALLDISVVKTLLWSGLSTFYVLLLSPIFLKEKITGKKIVGALLGFFGMAIYLVLGNDTGELLTLSHGDLYGFLCGVSMIGFYIISSKMKEQPLYWRLSFTWLPGFLLLPILLIFFPVDFSFSSFLFPYFSLIFFAMLSTSIFMSMFFYQLSVKYLEASKITVIRMLEPVFQGFTAFLIVGEVLNFWQGIGAMIVLSGIFIVQKKRVSEVDKVELLYEQGI